MRHILTGFGVDRKDYGCYEMLQAFEEVGLESTRITVVRRESRECRALGMASKASLAARLFYTNRFRDYVKDFDLLLVFVRRALQR